MDARSVAEANSFKSTVWNSMRADGGAVFLAFSFGLLLLVGLLVEVGYGSEIAQWTVYRSWLWRFWWAGLALHSAVWLVISTKRGTARLGRLAVQVGILLLVSGAAITLGLGDVGEVTLNVGDVAREMVVAERSQLDIRWVNRPGDQSQRLSFTTGPADWSKGQSLKVGNWGDYEVRVARFYRHARPVTEFVDDLTSQGGPQVQFQVVGPQGKVVADHFLVDELFGDALLIGPVRMQLSRATSQAMLNDFLNPPDASTAKQGLLLAYYGDDAVRVDVAESMGRRVPIGESGACVELSAFLPNARPDRLGNFTSKDDELKNPMLEVKLFWSGNPEGRRQIAMAREPLLNLDGVYGRACPVKLVYVHPAIPPSTGIELIQGPDQRLYGRTCVNGTYSFHSPVTKASRLKISDSFEFVVLGHRPHVRKEVRFEPSLGSTARSMQLEPAIRVDLCNRTETRSVWVPRQSAQVRGETEVDLEAGRLAISFGPLRQSLASPIRLVSVRDRHTGTGDGVVVSSSELELIDAQGQVAAKIEPKLGVPAAYAGASLHQMVSRMGGHGRPRSTLTVVEDPGRIWKCAGMLMICVGLTASWLSGRGLFQRRTVESASEESGRDSSG